MSHTKIDPQPFSFSDEAAFDLCLINDYQHNQQIICDHPFHLQGHHFLFSPKVKRKVKNIQTESLKYQNRKQSHEPCLTLTCLSFGISGRSTSSVTLNSISCSSFSESGVSASKAS